ncbi:MAG: bifunctional methionine sulfoxide reductase B/A protein [Bacteroidales bacterium]|nr:bifunctional methionine sulfoxide reductase B/A protein [Bacteroidales bacterium]
MNGQEEKYNKLTPEEERVIIRKGTEAPFTGEYDKFFKAGTYHCKRCDAPLYRSEDKFRSGCGWPSFDDEIGNAVKQIPDADGRRTEIVCASCGAHLGHIFEGEHFTEKNTRHCVNSVSMIFKPKEEVNDITQNKTEIAIFSGGCFWGVEFYMRLIDGVISTEVGYIGGIMENPTYEDVCSHETGYAEAVKIIFDSNIADFETIAKTFFEIHDPTHLDHQGPDVGDQYRSEVFYTTPQQREITIKLIRILQKKGYKVVTKVTPATTFWTAEDYHQQYYYYKQTTPYCHGRTKRF